MSADSRFQIVVNNRLAVRDFATGINYQLRSLADAIALLKLLRSLEPRGNASRVASTREDCNYE